MTRYVICEDNGRNAQKTKERIIKTVGCSEEQVNIALWFGQTEQDIEDAAVHAAEASRNSDLAIFIMDLAYTDSPSDDQLRHGIKVLKRIAELLENGNRLAFFTNARYRVLFMTVQDPGSLADINRLVAVPAGTISVLPVTSANEVTQCATMLSSTLIPLVKRGANYWIERVAQAWFR